MKISYDIFENKWDYKIIAIETNTIYISFEGSNQIQLSKLIYRKSEIIEHNLS